MVLKALRFHWATDKAHSAADKSPLQQMIDTWTSWVHVCVLPTEEISGSTLPLTPKVIASKQRPSESNLESQQTQRLEHGVNQLVKMAWHYLCTQNIYVSRKYKNFEEPLGLLQASTAEKFTNK